MINKMPEDLKTLIAKATLDSYENGVRTRKTATLRCLAIVVLVMLVTSSAPPYIMVAALISASTILIVRAIFSMSASLNWHTDTVMRIIIHYAEENKKGS